MSNQIDQLVKALMNLPGIGPRQAERYAFYLLQHPSSIGEISRALAGLSGTISQCQECFRYFPSNSKNASHCDICLTRNQSNTLMVVEKDVDLITVEKSGVYKGLYFVLGGLIPILEKEPENKIRLSKLVNRIESLKKTGLTEIIIALSASPVGDHTAEFLIEYFHQIRGLDDIKVSMLGRGLSTGTEIEYSDTDTLLSALERRTSR